MTSEHRAFPLTAEQIVRGVGHVLALWLNRNRRGDEPKLDADGITIVLAAKMGVPLPVEDDENSPTGKRLLPYGSVKATSAAQDTAREAPPPSRPTAGSRPPERS